MRRVDMMKMIRETTERYQLIRVLKTTAHLQGIDEAESLRSEMAHGPQMQWKYVSRPK